MKPLILFSLLTLWLVSARSQVIPDSALLNSSSPVRFQVLFKTTKGDFVIEVKRDWSPLAADRLFQLVRSGFYNRNSLFRVQKGYVVQFGICDLKDVNNFWDKRPIADEPVKTSNLQGTISFARDGKNSRTSQLFINLKDNYKLDTVNFNGLRGFPPVAKIISGFEVIEALYAGYGFEPANHQDSVMIYGNAYLKKKFPDLDYILEATLINQ